MEKPMVVFEDLGTAEYKEVWDYQEKIFSGMIAGKQHSANVALDAGRLLFVEHPHVYTLGKSGHENNLLINDAFLKSIGATYFKSNRGGDITYHGPGQIVGYPIFDLEQMSLQIKTYVYALEQSIINTLAEIGIPSQRLEGATGVWLDVDKPGRARKICAIGVKASRHVTMHGFALNVNTDLSYFNHINPCGFVDKGVTSIERELGQKQDLARVKALLLRHMGEVFGCGISGL
ncbi:MAG: lipoyl(octanoyl) transferase LipB [Breznakibacter sp.]